MRYGLVGTGFWANEVHARAIASREDGEFIGVWGRDAEKAAQVTRQWGGKAFSSPSKLFADTDVVSFAVPPEVQTPLAIEAADAECHLLLEKPIALDPPQADQLVETAMANEVSSVVFFTFRFKPLIADWITTLQQTGGWQGGRAAFVAAVFHPDSPFKDSPWRKREGAIWDLGPHLLSLLLPILGEVVGLEAVRGSEDTAQVVMRHRDGQSSTFTATLTAPKAAERVEAAFFGEAGWEYLPDDPTTPVVALGNALEQLVESISTGEPHPCGVEFGRQVVGVLSQAATKLGNR